MRLQLGALGGVSFIPDGVFQLDHLGVHIPDPGADALQLANCDFALIQRLCQVVLNLDLLLFQHRQLPFEQLHNRIGFRDQVLQFVINRRGPHTFLPHAVGLCTGEYPDNAFPTRLVAHLVEITAEPGGDIIQPHDQLCDVRVHHIRMSMHIFQRGVFDVDHRIIAGFQLGARGLDPGGQLGDLALRFRNLGLGFAYLCIQIGHQTLLFSNPLNLI